MPSLSKSLSRLRPENCHRHPVCALSCPMAEKGGSPSVSRGGLRAKLNNICSWDHRIIVVIRPIIVVIYGYDGIYIYMIILVRRIPTILKNMMDFVSWDNDEIPNIFGKS
jgi:hypothetical protein